MIAFKNNKTGISKSNKKFSANGIALFVQRRFQFSNKKHNKKHFSSRVVNESRKTSSIVKNVYKNKQP